MIIYYKNLGRLIGLLGCYVIGMMTAILALKAWQFGADWSVISALIIIAVFGFVGVILLTGRK